MLYAKLILLSAPATRIVSIIALSLFFAGCQSPRVVVIPADKHVQRMKAETVYLFPISGWFVPDARMQEIMFQLEEKLDAESAKAKTHPNY
jgi:hypothetical protein